MAAGSSATRASSPGVAPELLVLGSPPRLPCKRFRAKETQRDSDPRWEARLQPLASLNSCLATPVVEAPDQMVVVGAGDCEQPQLCLLLLAHKWRTF